MYISSQPQYQGCLTTLSKKGSCRIVICIDLSIKTYCGQWADALHLYGGLDAPAPHESPAALQVDLGKSKAKGVKPDRKS